MTFMEVKARNEEPSIHIEKAEFRRAKASGMSRTMVQEIKRGANRIDARETSFSTPDKDTKTPKIPIKRT
jgi:hypothetical protein